MTYNNQNVSDAEFEHLDAKAASDDRLSNTTALMRIENDTLTSIARAKPRDEVAIANKLKGLIDAFPAFAEECIYAKPVGRAQMWVCDACKAETEQAVRWGKQENKFDCSRCGGNNGKRKGLPFMKFARGLSVKAAEALLPLWGCARVSIDVEPFNQTSVKLIGRWTDLQSGVATSLPSIVSRMARRKGGAVEQLDDERFTLLLKAEASKVKRETINRNISPLITSMLFAICDERQKKMMTDDRIDKTVTAFAEFGFSAAEVERLVGRPRHAGWTGEDRANLSAIYTSLKSGELTKAELLKELSEPDPIATTASAGNGSATVTADALTGATTAATPTTVATDATTPSPQQQTHEPAQTEPAATTGQQSAQETPPQTLPASGENTLFRDPRLDDLEGQLAKCSPAVGCNKVRDAFLGRHPDREADIRSVVENRKRSLR